MAPLLPVLLVLVLVALLALLALAASSRRAGAREPALVLAARLGGLLLGVAAAVVGGHAWALGRGVLLAPTLVGTGLLLGIAVGETLARPERGPGPRTADLTPRTLRAHAPRHLTAAVAAALLVLAALLVVTTATASPDDLGRAGRALTRACSPTTSSSRGPYPGSFYSSRLVVALLVALGAAVVAARRAVSRPRGQGADEDALRRRSVQAVVAGLGVVVSATFVGVAAVTALAWHQVCAAGVLGDLVVPLVAATFLAGALLVLCVAVLLAPARRTPDRRPMGVR